METNTLIASYFSNLPTLRPKTSYQTILQFFEHFVIVENLSNNVSYCAYVQLDKLVVLESFQILMYVVK